MPRKIIFFELNEVPFRVLDDYCSRHPTSVLASRLSRFRQYQTINEDTDLDPWVSWPTVHRGVGDARHGIHNFGQQLSEVDAEYPPVWQLLTQRGVKTGVFGSFHTWPLPADLSHYTFILPDTFARQSDCFPSGLAAFQDFNLAMARRSGRNVSTAIPRDAAWRFLMASPSLGLKARTLLSTAGQLASEKVNSWRRVRRRTYQVVLGFDIFLKQLRRTQPDFSTFYTNHVASAMHRYWAAAYPQDYASFGYDDAWVARFRGEIDYAMGWFEAFFARLVRFVDAHPEFALWVSTSMGQAATKAITMDTQLYVTDPNRFMVALGFEPEQWQRMPAMEPDVAFQIRESEADRFRTLVSGMRIDGAPVHLEESARGFFCVGLGQPNLKGRVDTVSVGGRILTLAELGMEHVEIEDKANGSAQHVREGMLLVYESGAAPQSGQRPVISTLEIAPAILRNFDISVPGYMTPGRLAA